MGRLAESLLPDFGGDTYRPARDQIRLTGQLQRVYELMSDGAWRSLSDIVQVVGGSEAGISARLRDYRKPKFGAHNVERRHCENGLWQYRLLIAK